MLTKALTCLTFDLRASAQSQNPASTPKNRKGYCCQYAPSATAAGVRSAKYINLQFVFLPTL